MCVFLKKFMKKARKPGKTKKEQATMTKKTQLFINYKLVFIIYKLVLSSSLLTSF